MENMTELAEKFTAIGIAWNGLLDACKKGEIELAKNCKSYIEGYITGLLGDGILTYEDKLRLCEEMQSHISNAESSTSE